MNGINHITFTSRGSRWFSLSRVWPQRQNLYLFIRQYRGRWHISPTTRGTRMETANTAVQSQKAVSAYFTSKQIPPLGFAGISGSVTLFDVGSREVIRRWSWYTSPGRDTSYRDNPGFPWPPSGSALLCKAKRQYLLTLKVSRYCLLALLGRATLHVIIASSIDKGVIKISL